MPAELAAAERRARALAAAAEVARAHGLAATAPRILQDWNDTIVHLVPEPVVARVATSEIRAAAAATALRREVDVAAYALRHEGPVVPPTVVPPPGPHEVDGLTLTFWEYAAPVGGAPAGREVGEALRALHEALAGYGPPLPRLASRLAHAQALAAHLPALAGSDRDFLGATLAELRRRSAAFGSPARVLHGGAHTANLLRTAQGLRWIDLDTVCTGPLEWDLAHLDDRAAAAFPEANHELLPLMRLLVGAVVAVWCWRAYGRAPEVDEAARFHLARLRAAVASAS